jgi:periplasmic protein TonB
MSDGKEIAKMESGPVNFGECLVEGSAADKKRGRKIKRRAIALSIALQSLGLTALVIAPMLAKPAELKVVSTMPIPPYSSRPATRHATETHTNRATPQRCSFCAPTKIPPNVVTVDKGYRQTDPGPDIPLGFSTDKKDGLLNVLATQVQPLKPDQPKVPKPVVVGHIDAAMLVHRVEPVFPAILKQLHRSGKVELHALIATDGTIQSLEVVSGDPMCVQSALDAVRQWRYRPTLLNGQAVEVDTFITVIYTTQQQ